MNQPLQLAFDDYSKYNANFSQLLDWHLCHGFVLCRPECFAIGFFAHSTDAMCPIERDKADSLFITYCAGKMGYCLKQFEDEFEFVVFQRQFKNSPHVRVWDYKKTFNRIK